MRGLTAFAPGGTSTLGSRVLQPEQVLLLVRSVVHSVVGTSVDRDVPLMQAGLDSLSGVELDASLTASGGEMIRVAGGIKATAALMLMLSLINLF